MNYNKQIIFNSTFSIIQIFTTAVATFFLYKFIANKLGVEQLGLWSIVLSVSSITNMGNLGLGISLLKFSAEYDAKNDHKSINILLNNSVIILSCILLFIIFILYFGALKGLHFIIPSEKLPAALLLLPYAMSSLFFNALGSLFLAVVDGMNKGFIRSIGFISSTLFFVILGVVLTNKHGLIGLAYAQLAQAIFFFLYSVIAVKFLVTGYKFFYLSWDKQIVKQALVYGSGYQAISIAQMMYDPVTKIFLSKYGGLQDVGFFEMASKLVLQTRSILSTIFQNLVPKITVLNFSNQKEKLLENYKLLNRFNVFLLCFIYSTIIALAPVITNFWLGSINMLFVIYLIALSFGWMINSLTIPPYMFNLGMGNLKGNVLAHILIAVLNCLLCFTLGLFFGGFGVIIGWIISLTSGSIYLLFEFSNRNFNVTKRFFVNNNSLSILIVFIFSIFSISLCFNFVNKNSTIDFLLILFLYLFCIAFFIRNQNMKALLKDIYLKYK